MMAEMIKVIDYWQKVALEGPLFDRDIRLTIPLDRKEVQDIAGIRRGGKSSVCKLLLRTLPADAWLYINFEDPYFIEHNQATVIEQLVETATTVFSKNITHLFFDEIQNIEHWEKAIRKMRDAERYRIFVTGSSSKLVSGELASLLTGRHITHTLMPLSFREFLSFKKVPAATVREQAVNNTAIAAAFGEYLETGGFPEIVRSGDHALLKQYYLDIVERDILKRHDIRDKTLLTKLGLFLISNTGSTVSLTSLKNTYGVSFPLISAYVEYFKEAFLLYDLPQFSYSLKTQQKAQKKIYCADTGLARAVSFSFSENKGWMLENAAFLHLKRLGKELFYWKGTSGEVDFLCKRRDETFEAYQVCWDISDKKTEQREVRAIVNATKELPVKSAFILTAAESATIETGTVPITVMPLRDFLLRSE